MIKDSKKQERREMVKEYPADSADTNWTKKEEGGTSYV